MADIGTEFPLISEVKMQQGDVHCGIDFPIAHFSTQVVKLCNCKWFHCIFRLSANTHFCNFTLIRIKLIAEVAEINTCESMSPHSYSPAFL